MDSRSGAAEAFDGAALRAGEGRAWLLFNLCFRRICIAITIIIRTFVRWINIKRDEKQTICFFDIGGADVLCRI